MIKLFKKYRPIIIFFSLTALVVALSVTSVYFYKKAHRLQLGPNDASQEEIRSLVKEVGKLIVLPADEMPTIATVSDPEKLKDQPFFVDAKIGDKVLIYSAAKKAILYDPVAEKIVNVAPINLDSTAQGTTTR